jgi:hypothetical protein
MTNTNTAVAPSTDVVGIIETYHVPFEYVVTDCPDHGVKVTSDFASFRVYVDAARECDPRTVDHTRAHGRLAPGVSCWECCPKMVIDPYGFLDH